MPTATANSTRPRLLIADDQAPIVEALRLLLKPEGYRIDDVASPAEALDRLTTQEFDALLVDLNYTRDTTSGREGLDLISAIRQRDATVPIIVMTAWANVALAVDAMHRGASDFVQKPWDNARLLTILRTQLELAQLQRRTRRLEAENRLLRAEGAPDFIAEAPSMRPVVDLMTRIGPSDANILITGEHVRRGQGPRVPVWWSEP
jgi:DNA-binding NtrC family response regulator